MVQKSKKSRMKKIGHAPIGILFFPFSAVILDHRRCDVIPICNHRQSSQNALPHYNRISQSVVANQNKQFTQMKIFSKALRFFFVELITINAMKITNKKIKNKYRIQNCIFRHRWIFWKNIIGRKCWNKHTFNFSFTVHLKLICTYLLFKYLTSVWISKAFCLQEYPIKFVGVRKSFYRVYQKRYIWNATIRILRMERG